MQIKQDSYRESQVRTMLAHETDPNETHYAARLSHWWGDAKDINIEADALALLAEAFAGKKPLFFLHLPGLTNLDIVKLLQTFDVFYGNTMQETTEWALEYQVLTRMLIHEQSLLVNPTFLDISEEEVLQEILACLPDAAKQAYLKARQLGDEEVQRLFDEWEE